MKIIYNFKTLKEYGLNANIDTNSMGYIPSNTLFTTWLIVYATLSYNKIPWNYYWICPNYQQLTLILPAVSPKYTDQH